LGPEWSNMNFYLSTIADVDFSCDMNEMQYSFKTSRLAKEYGMGLEIAELCISENLDRKFDKIIPHIEENIRSNSELILHGPFNELFPHAIDEKVAKIAYDRYSFAYEFCEKYGIKKLVLHSNYIKEIYHIDWYTIQNVKFWNEFLASNKGSTVICLENVMDESPKALMGIMKAVDDKRLRICLDVGHANLTGTAPMIWLKECKEYLSHLHLHNNYGPKVNGLYPVMEDTHSALDVGTIDIDALLGYIKKEIPDASLTLETRELDESIAWLTKKGYI